MLICLHATSNLSSPFASAALILSPRPPSDASASLWRVISRCRENTTGRPAGFTSGSGKLPQAVTCRSTQRNLAGFGSHKTPGCCVFLRSQLSFIICRFLLARLSICDDLYSDVKQTNSAILLLVIHLVAPVFKQTL